MRKSACWKSKKPKKEKIRRAANIVRALNIKKLRALSFPTLLISTWLYHQIIWHLRRSRIVKGSDTCSGLSSEPLMWTRWQIAFWRCAAKSERRAQRRVCHLCPNPSELVQPLVIVALFRRESRSSLASETPSRPKSRPRPCLWETK